jgi:hypothetical protein
MEIVFNDYVSLYVSLMITLYVFSILYGYYHDYGYNYLFNIEFLTDVKITEMTNIRLILLTYFVYDIITRNKKLKMDKFYHHILSGLLIIITHYIDRYDGMFIMTTLCEVSTIFLSFNNINRYKIMLSNFLFLITFFIFRICLMSKLILIMIIGNFDMLNRFGLSLCLCLLYCQLQVLNFYWFYLMMKIMIKKLF